MDTISLSLTERLVLANQFRILAALNPSESDDCKDLIEVLERGFSAEYSRVFTRFHREGLGQEDCNYVSEVLEMFWNLQDAYDQLGNKAGLDDRDVRFPGFDGNNENAFLQYAKHLCKSGFRGFRSSSSMNSHSQTTRRYGLMLERYHSVPIARRRGLSAEEIRSIIEF